MSEATKERWIQWVALTTTILAVCTAIVTLYGGKNSTRMQLLATDESNGWSYFQSKSIKQHTCEVARDMLRAQQIQAKDPETSANLHKLMAAYDADIARYDKEKKEVETSARVIGEQEKIAKARAPHFSMAVVFMQISIMLNSVSALLKRKQAWMAGIAFGVIGLLFFANAFWLWL